MKKLYSYILILVLTTVFLSACNGEKVESGPITITIWHDKEDAIVEVMTSAFESLNPKINVVMEKKEGLTDALKLVGNDPASAPDMYFFAHDKIGVYAEMGILEPITTFLTEEELSAYVGMTTEAVTYKDTVYQLPLYYETLLFMYNKKLMSEDQVPKTTDELLYYMKDHTKDGFYGFVEQHSTAYYGVPWLHGFGGKVVTAEGEPLLTSEEVINALMYHKQFLEFMPNESAYATVNTLFLEGYAHATINGPWLVPSVREAGIELGFSKMPIVNETGIPLSPFAGVQGIHVLKVAVPEKQEAIQAVLNTLKDPEVGISLALISGSAPAVESCYDDERITGDEMIMTMRETADAAVPMPNIPEMDVMFIVTGNLLVSVNMNDMDINTAAEEQQSKAERLIEAMK